MAKPGQLMENRPALLTSSSMPLMVAQDPSHHRTGSNASARSPFVGRPIARPPSALSGDPGTASHEKDAVHRTPSLQYMEQGTRWMEKQETKSIRAALEDMDVVREKEVHAAAQDEAAKLVWRHQNPDAPFTNPDPVSDNPDVRKDYKSHLRKGSYQRSHSQEHVPTMHARKTSGGSSRISIDASLHSTKTSLDAVRKVSPPTAIMTMKKTRTPSGKTYGDLAEAVKDDIVRAHRRTSSGSKRIMSGEKKIFMHKNDRIWEDPQEEATPPKRVVVQNAVRPSPSPAQPASHIRKNPFSRMRMQQDRLIHSNSAPVLPVAAKHDRVEIQRNPPTQSKRAWYMSNEPLPPTPPPSRDELGADEVASKASLPPTPTKDGQEIRGDDIRAATSKQRKDRSPNLPQPTLVSDKPGRPIVSFQNRKPKEIVLEEVHSEPTDSVKAAEKSTFNPAPYVMPPKPHVTSANGNGEARPAIPTICVPDDPTLPSIVLPEEPDFAETNVQSAPPTPSINLGPSPFEVSVLPAPPLPRSSRQRPLPTPTPHHAATSPLPKSTPHYTPTTVRQSGALCAHCALPIAGRILSAAGQRFHPSCFVCYECNTNLELVAFYPEPDNKRQERLERISARLTGGLPIGITEDELWSLERDDGDEGLRFYCHLDFHELFSPRCKSCKTPIEGEVVVACGAEWHVGHFFCAQCGDPFDNSTPFVEKDGYAWCVGCHTNRYSSKCRKCRKPVTDLVVKALGADWHDGCFKCLVRYSDH